MKSTFRDSLLGLTLGYVALGLTVIAGAFAVRPVKASPVIFWVLIALGLAALVAGAISHFRRRGPRRQLVAAECRRIHAGLKKVLVEQERRRPKPGRFGNGNERHAAWLEETLSRYEHELRSWAIKVFDQAVTIGVLSEASRPMLDGKSLLQLNTVRDLFRDAAEELEQL